MEIQLFSQGCPVCQTQTPTEHHCYHEGKEYLQCQNCQLVFQTGSTDLEAMIRCYTGGAFKRFRRKALNQFRKIENQRDFELRMTRANAIFDYAAKQSQKTSGTYLDIGCNKGFNLYAADEKGWNAYGNELIEEITIPIKNSKPHLKNKILVGAFTKLAEKYENNFFDLITCIDVIEHLPNPEFALEHIYRILKPGGVVIFQTPEVTDQNLAMKERWGALKADEHLLLFNQNNFSTMADRVGFRDMNFAPEPFEVCDGNFVVSCWR